jgi:hypothetical protein
MRRTSLANARAL